MYVRYCTVLNDNFFATVSMYVRTVPVHTTTIIFQGKNNIFFDFRIQNELLTNILIEIFFEVAYVYMEKIE